MIFDSFRGKDSYDILTICYITALEYHIQNAVDGFFVCFPRSRVCLVSKQRHKFKFQLFSLCINTQEPSKKATCAEFALEAIQYLAAPLLLFFKGHKETGMNCISLNSLPRWAIYKV
jgi:hypothetical protein